MTTLEQDKVDPGKSDFPRPSRETWTQAAAASNGGLSADRLISQTYEGITVQPLYVHDDIEPLEAVRTIPGRPPYMRGENAAGYLIAPWEVAQEIAHGLPVEFNRVVTQELESGLTAINMVLDGPTRAGQDPDKAHAGDVGRGGVSLATVEDVSVALEDVNLLPTSLSIRVGTAGLPVLALLVAHLRWSGRLPELHGCLENDPLADLVAQGTLPLPLDRAYDEMAQQTRWAAQQAPRLMTVAVHTAPYHDAGVSAVMELAFGLATGVAYLRALDERGIDVNLSARHMRFDLVIGDDFFMEIAKLRAARLLWSKIVAACGGDDDAQRMRIHARTGTRNKSELSPHVNMIRVTTEALAAAIGGTQSMHLGPYDEVGQPPDDFARRIARNVQIILQQEAGLSRVIDPAGGSYAVEKLTDQLAARAWTLFQEVERQGGMYRALKHGFIQGHISVVAQKRSERMATQTGVMVGVNRFADPREASPAGDQTKYRTLYNDRIAALGSYRDRRAAVPSAALERLAGLPAAEQVDVVEAAIDAAIAGATLGEIAAALRTKSGARPRIAQLKTTRWAEPFENLRRDVARYEIVHQRPACIFMANIGAPRYFRARAAFAREFFEAGGFIVLDNDGFPDMGAAIGAARDSSAQVMVICSADDAYPLIVPRLVQAVRKNGPEPVILLSSEPNDRARSFRAAGVDALIYPGADCLALNEWLLSRILSLGSSSGPSR